MHYTIRFHNEPGYLVLKANCKAELNYKLSKYTPDLFLKSATIYKDFEIYIKSQK